MENLGFLIWIGFGREEERRKFYFSSYEGKEVGMFMVLLWEGKLLFILSRGCMMGEL